MARILWLVSVTMTISVLVGCKADAATQCNEADKPCLQKALSSHTVKSLSAWDGEFEKPLSHRIDSASTSLIEYITLDNQLNGFTERPAVPNLDPEFLEDFKAALDELPANVQKLVADRLVGIRLVTRLGGTGYTDYVYNSKGDVAGAFVVFDSDVLKSKTANQWATWKEKTPFDAESGFEIAAQIETDGLDNRRNAIQYILLHELGHVASVGRDIHPSWDPNLRRRAPMPKSFPFFEISWLIDSSTRSYKTKFDAAFPERKDVVYYKTARISAAQSVQTYSNLEKTNFATLYATTNPADDFAESLASYVHVVLLGRPWQIEIAKDGKVIKTVQSCWDQSRCAEKRKFLEDLIGL